VLYPAPAAADEEEPPESQTADRDVRELPATPSDLPADEQAFVRALEERLNGALLEVTAETATVNASGAAARAIPLPGFVERFLMKRLVRDAHHYLYASDFEPRPGEKYNVQKELRKRFVEAVERGSKKPGPHVVVSHSMGTMIAYDCLKHVPECGKVDALVTLGTPLGLSEVQDGFGKAWRKSTAFPAKTLGTDRWVNFYDRLDVVCAASPTLAGDYRNDDATVIDDQRITNVGRWRHAVREYFARDEIRKRLKSLLGL
jgi:pimeloyl-ACP methyl ester carboxylesterase